MRTIWLEPIASQALRTQRSVVLDVPMLRRESKASFCRINEALSGGPPRAPEILPGTAIRVALGIQNLRTRVFGGVELKDHPLRIRNARIRRSVQEPDVIVRELLPPASGGHLPVVTAGLGGAADHQDEVDNRRDEEPDEP